MSTLYNFFNKIISSYKLQPHVPEVPIVNARRLDYADHYEDPLLKVWGDGYQLGDKNGYINGHKVGYAEGLNKGYIDGHYDGSVASGLIGSGAATTLSGALWGGNTWIQHSMALRAATSVAAAHIAGLTPEVIGAPIALGAVAPEAVVVGAPVAGALMPVAATLVAAEAPVLAASAVLGPLVVVGAGLGLLGGGVLNNFYHHNSVHGV